MTPFRFRRLAAVLFPALLAACGDTLGPITELPRELTVAERNLIEADNRFAFSLFREINAQEDPAQNVFISPLSVGMALGMAYNGAAGTTRDAMQQTLELHGMSIAQVNEAYRTLIDLLQQLDPRAEWLLANSLWHRPEFTPKQTYLDVVSTYFDAEIQALDFSDAGAANTINDWVSQKTRDRIPAIVPDPIPGHIVAYLINAIFFKGTWTQQFDKDLTKGQAFTLSDGDVVLVPMMSGEDEHDVRMTRAGDVTVAELPYGGGAYVMTVVLPAQPADAQALATTISQEQWTSWIGDLDSTSIFVSLPKFKLEYAIRLNDVLKALGMQEAFDPCRADFSNMFVIRPGENFYIDDVRHKTFVEVNEEGTEAAAATSVGFGRVVSIPPRIVVDRPFLFAIRERLSGTILFMGKIMDPTAKDEREIESPPETCAG